MVLSSFVTVRVFSQLGAHLHDPGNVTTVTNQQGTFVLPCCSLGASPAFRYLSEVTEAMAGIDRHLCSNPCTFTLFSFS